ncbi:MAG: DUF2953 domain-containing protein [Lachnospiraceae bacterium]|nr:DUF2953 domain-containing protein [Lachnospiraceae bacterium]
MAGIILTILKVIGIILLVLVGLVLLVAVAVLVCPVKYHVRASKKADEIKVHIQGSYLFPLLSFSGCYESGKDMVYSLKLFFLTLYPQKDKPAKKRKKTAAKSQKPKKQKELSKSKRMDASEEDTSTPVGEKVIEPEREHKQLKQPETVFNEKLKEPQKEKEQIHFIHKIQAKLLDVKEKVQRFWDGMKKLLENVKEFRDFISSQETRDALKFLNEQRKYIFRHLKPSKVSISLRYGFEDPALTGEVLAAYSCIYPFLWGDILVEPDFEQVCLDGNGELKGKVRLYGFLLTGWRCYRHETIRKIIEKVM